MPNISSEEFDALVKTHFKFLTDDYNFSLVKKSDWVYEFESSKAKLSIFAEHNTLVVGLEPIGEAAKSLLRNNILPKRLDVIVVSRVVNTNLDYKTIWDEPFPSAMERKSNLVKSNCAEFLRGDFSKWGQIQEAIKKR